MPAGTTLGRLVEVADNAKIPLREALAKSPHLVDTLMLNGERCPLAENADRVLARRRRAVPARAARRRLSSQIAARNSAP